MQIMFAFVAREASSDMAYPLGGTMGESFTARHAGYDISGSRKDGPAFSIVVCGRRSEEPTATSIRVEIRTLDDRIVYSTHDIAFSDSRATGLPTMLKHDMFFVFPIQSVPPSRTNEFRAVVLLRDGVVGPNWEDAYSFVFVP